MFECMDLEALTALVLEDARKDVEDVLATLEIPILLFAGEADGDHTDAERCVESLPNATFVSLPGLGHIETQYRPDLMVPHIRKFLAEVGEG